MSTAPPSRAESRAQSRGGPPSRAESRQSQDRAVSRQSTSRRRLSSRGASQADIWPTPAKISPHLQFLKNKSYLFREKISEAERKLVQSILQDGRWLVGRKAYLEQLSSCITRHPEGSAGRGNEGVGDFHREPRLQWDPAETIITAWATDCIRLCLEDWEVEKSACKLQSARLQVEKLDKDKMDAHRCYMQELQMLREKIWHLERKSKVEFDIPSDDLVFYEPLQYLDEPLKARMKEIVIYKVKTELASGLDNNLQDLNHTLLTRTKQQEAMIKDLKEELKDKELELSTERQKADAAVLASRARRGSKVKLDERKNTKEGYEPNEEFPPTPQSRRRGRRDGLVSPVLSEYPEEDDDGLGPEGPPPGSAASGAQMSMARTASRQSLMTPMTTFFEDSEEVKARRRKWRCLRGQLAEAKGMVRDTTQQIRHLDFTVSMKDSSGEKKDQTFLTSMDMAEQVTAPMHALAGMSRQAATKMRKKYEDDLKRANNKVAELEQILEDYNLFDDGIEVIDSCVGPGPEGEVDKETKEAEEKKKHDLEEKARRHEAEKVAKASKEAAARESELVKKVAALEEQKKQMEAQAAKVAADMAKEVAAAKAKKEKGLPRPDKTVDAAEAKAATESAVAKAKAAAEAKAAEQSQEAAAAAVKAEREAVAAAAKKRERALLKKLAGRPPAEDPPPADRKLTYQAAVKEMSKILNDLRGDIETVGELTTELSDEDPHHVLANWMRRRVAFLEQSLGNSLEPTAESKPAGPSKKFIAMKEELEELRDQNSQLEISLAEMQDKLKDMRKALADAGMEDVAEEIFERVGLKPLMKSGRVCVFDRLYNDAIKRIKQDPAKEKAVALMGAIRKMNKPKKQPARRASQMGQERRASQLGLAEEAEDEDEDDDDFPFPLELLESMKCCVCGGLKLFDDADGDESTPDAAALALKRASIASLQGRASLVSQQGRTESPRRASVMFPQPPTTPMTPASTRFAGGGFNLSLSVTGFSTGGLSTQSAARDGGLTTPSAAREASPSPIRPLLPVRRESDLNELDSTLLPVVGVGLGDAAESKRKETLHGGASTGLSNQLDAARSRPSQQPEVRKGRATISPSPQQDDSKPRLTIASLQRSESGRLSRTPSALAQQSEGGRLSRTPSALASVQQPEDGRLSRTPSAINSSQQPDDDRLSRTQPDQQRRSKTPGVWPDTGSIREMHTQQATQLEDRLRQMVFMDMMGQAAEGQRPTPAVAQASSTGSGQAAEGQRGTPHNPLPIFQDGAHAAEGQRPATHAGGDKREALGEQLHFPQLNFPQHADREGPRLPAVGPRPYSVSTLGHSASAPALHPSTPGYLPGNLRASESAGTLPPLEGSGVHPREAPETRKNVTSPLAPARSKGSNVEDYFPREARSAALNTGKIHPDGDFKDASLLEHSNRLLVSSQRSPFTSQNSTAEGLQPRITTAPSQSNRSGKHGQQWVGPDKIHSFAPDDFRRAQRRMELLEKSRNPPRLGIHGSKTRLEPT